MKQEIAAALLSTRIPTAQIGMTVEAVRHSVFHERCRWDSVTYVYVLDAERRPVGVASMKELICADATAPIDAVMHRPVITAHLATDQEHVAMRAIRHGIKAVPIVDHDGRFLGVIGTDAILKTLHEKHVEHFLRFAGIRRTDVVTDMLTARISTLIHARLPWLLIGLVGAMLMTLLVRAFADALERELGLAFFIPLIVYMADAFSTQTQALYVRGLALERIPFLRTLGRELAIAFGIGATCAVLLYGFAFIAFRSAALAGTVAIALVITMLVAAALELMVSALLQRMRRDPALGGGPLATVVQDAVSILLYFFIASAFLL
ncbi:MAG: magnesium transporter [Patescibacteria group bacterium]